MILIESVKQVRERSGAPLSDCKSALNEAKGDIDEALVILQKKGVAKAVSKAARRVAEGRIHPYVHPGNKIAVIVEVNCETDFVAKNEDFLLFCEEVAMQVAAMKAEFLSPSEIASDQENDQKRIFQAQLKEEGKPEAVWPKIIDGKFRKWHSEVCLLNQESVVHQNKTIDQLRLELVAKLGENIQIRRFARMEVGEGLVKKTENFALEVALLAATK